MEKHYRAWVRGTIVTVGKGRWFVVWYRCDVMAMVWRSYVFCGEVVRAKKLYFFNIIGNFKYLWG